MGGHTLERPPPYQPQRLLECARRCCPWIGAHKPLPDAPVRGHRVREAIPGADLEPRQIVGFAGVPAEPPAKVSRGPGGEPAHVYGSLLCEGSIISGAHVERSILGPGVYVDHDAHVTDSILFPYVRVGPGARLHRCIIDKNVEIPSGYRIGLDAGEDAERFTVSDEGIAVIEKDRDL